MLTIAQFKKYAQANLMEMERILEDVYTPYCSGKTDYTCFDGGAHKGFHTRRFAELPGCRRVIAVEASPDMAALLKQRMQSTCEKYEKIRFVDQALQRYGDVTQVTWQTSSSHSGRSSIVADDSELPTIWEHEKSKMDFEQEITVPATTIDKIMASETGPLEFLKLDLEGADMFALFGAEQTLTAHRPLLAFENSFYGPKVHDYKLKEAVAYFKSLDYVPLNFIGERLIHEEWFSFFEAWAAPKEKFDKVVKLVQAAIAKRSLD